VSFLLDTNVISEWVKARPNRGVVAWLATVDEDQVFISVVTLAELRHGIERMTTGGRRNQLTASSRWWATRFRQNFLKVTRFFIRNDDGRASRMKISLSAMRLAPDAYKSSFWSAHLA